MYVWIPNEVRIWGARRFYFVWALLFRDNVQTHLGGASIREGASNRDITVILGVCNLHKCWTWCLMLSPNLILLTHWGQVTRICISKLTIIGSDNGLSPKRRQAIIWTNAGILLIGSLGTNFGEILTEIHIFPLKEMHLKTKWQPFCLVLNVLTHTEAWTKWPIFCRLFQMYLLKTEFIFHSDFTKRFMMVQLTIGHDWFRKWLGPEQVTNNQNMNHICGKCWVCCCHSQG